MQTKRVVYNYWSPRRTSTIVFILLAWINDWLWPDKYELPGKRWLLHSIFIVVPSSACHSDNNWNPIASTRWPPQWININPLLFDRIVSQFFFFSPSLPRWTQREGQRGQWTDNENRTYLWTRSINVITPSRCLLNPKVQVNRSFRYIPKYILLSFRSYQSISVFHGFAQHTLMESWLVSSSLVPLKRLN